ncbi:MAG: hypothetical protein IKX54_04680 [Lachnospiraceae bacterium]|nr:hypothetical protein [Lachnospiraceae bacterium]
MNRWNATLKRIGIAAGVLFAALVLAVLPGKIAALAEDEVKDYVNAEQYENGYYEGEITKDDSSVRKTPGTKDASGKKKDDILKTTSGKSIILKAKTKVTVLGESKDSDLDTWYHIKGEFDGEAFEGYVYSGRLKRGVQVTFTPTPSPEPTDTPTPIPTEKPSGELIEDPTPTRADTTQQMLDDDKKDPANKYKWVIYVGGILLIGGAVFTLVTYISEKKIDEEMHRNNSRKKFEVERLEGETDEDYLEARKTAVKNQLKDQSNRDIAEEIGIDDFKLDLDGVFDDDGTDAAEAVSEVVTEAVSEDAAHAAETASAAVASEWNAQDEEFLRHLSDGADEQEQALLAQIVPNYAQSADNAAAENYAAQPEVPAEPTPEEILRGKLDLLREQDTLVHKEYGVGEVIDNSDAQIIQVRFGRDLRFLKKDRLARKHLVEL